MLTTVREFAAELLDRGGRSRRGRAPARRALRGAHRHRRRSRGSDDALGRPAPRRRGERPGRDRVVLPQRCRPSSPPPPVAVALLADQRPAGRGPAVGDRARGDRRDALTSTNVPARRCCSPKRSPRSPSATTPARSRQSRRFPTMIPLGRRARSPQRASARGLLEPPHPRRLRRGAGRGNGRVRRILASTATPSSPSPRSPSACSRRRSAAMTEPRVPRRGRRARRPLRQPLADLERPHSARHPRRPRRRPRHGAKAHLRACLDEFGDDQVGTITACFVLIAFAELVSAEAKPREAATPSAPSRGCASARACSPGPSRAAARPTCATASPSSSSLRRCATPTNSGAELRAHDALAVVGDGVAGRRSRASAAGSHRVGRRAHGCAEIRRTRSRRRRATGSRPRS